MERKEDELNARFVTAEGKSVKVLFTIVAKEDLFVDGNLLISNNTSYISVTCKQRIVLAKRIKQGYSYTDFYSRNKKRRIFHANGGLNFTFKTHSHEKQEFYCTFATPSNGCSSYFSNFYSDEHWR